MENVNFYNTVFALIAQYGETIAMLLEDGGCEEHNLDDYADKIAVLHELMHSKYVQCDYKKLASLCLDCGLDTAVREELYEQVLDAFDAELA